MIQGTLRQILTVGIIVAAGITIGSCRSETPIAAENASRPGNVASVPPEPKGLEPPPPLGRRDLLLAAYQARSEAALGEDDREAQKGLDNRRFEFRMRIGCTLTAPDAAAPAEAVYDPERRRVSLSVALGVSREDPLVAALAGEGVEAVEGFWLKRPWVLAPSCAGAAGAQPEIGLVQFFDAEHPRTDRRDGRAYEARVTLPEDAAPPSPGRWDLVLRGRLRAHGDGRVILCRAPAEGAMPVCLISVAFEQVVIEDFEGGEELATWGRG